MGKAKVTEKPVEALTPESLQQRYDNYDRFKIVWLDTRPDLPLSPGSVVMRWDLRPDIWNEVWPDLLFHPCAYMHAPQHPLRKGPPDPIELIRTLPPGFDWRVSAPPDLHPSVEAAVTELENNPELGAPVGKVLATSGTLYSIDTVGRPFAIGSLNVSEQGITAKANESLPMPRAHTLKNLTTTELLDKFCAALEQVPTQERARLADLLAVLGRAPDSPSTKRQIAAIIDTPH